MLVRLCEDGGCLTAAARNIVVGDWLPSTCLVTDEGGRRWFNEATVDAWLDQNVMLEPIADVLKAEGTALIVEAVSWLDNSKHAESALRDMLFR